MEKVVICGSEGFIAKHLVSRLKKMGLETCSIDLKYKFDPIDLTSYVDTKRHFEELTNHKKSPINLVFDLATLPLPLSLEKPYETAYKIYCMGAVLCELGREGYYKKLVHVSSSEAYGTAQYYGMGEDHPLEPRTPYAAGKAAEDMLMLSYYHSFGLPVVIGRPFNAYGPGQDLGAIIPATIKRILKGEKPLISGDGHQERELIYVDDIVDALIQLSKCQEAVGKVINIARGECYSVGHIVDTISDLMSYKGTVEYTKARPGDVQRHSANIQLIEELIPFKPKIALIEGLKRTIEWWKKKNL
jgi:UDP-glucose 4-epimerase